jgi:hypothetical protein
MYIFVFVCAYIYTHTHSDTHANTHPNPQTHTRTHLTHAHTHTRSHTSLAGKHIFERGVALLGHERAHEHLAVFCKHQPSQELIFEMCSSHVLHEHVCNF